MESTPLWADAANHGEQQLDDAVVTQLAHADQLRCSSHNNPKRRVADDVVDVHEKNPCAFTLAVF